MKIVALFNENSSCSYHRIILPYTHLKIEGEDSIILFNANNKIESEILQDADYLVFSRILPYPIDIIKQWKKVFGFKVIIDIDDSWELNVNHSLNYSWNQNKIPDNIIESIKFSDIVTTTSSILRDKIVKINKNTYLFPNALPFEEGQFVKKPENDNERIVLLYTGGQTHYYDLRMIVPTVSKLNHFPLLDFVVAGYDSEDPFWMKVDNLLSVTKNIYFKEYLPLDSYMNHYNIADFTVAPLEDNIFNNYKSNLKIIEAGCKNIPIICSNSYPYLQDKSEGVFTCKNNKDWYKTIKLLYKDRILREESGMILGNYVRENYNLFNINKERYSLLKSLK